MNKIIFMRTTSYLTLSLFSLAAFSNSLDKCSEQFIDSSINNAPTLFNSQPDTPFGSNKHLCYHDANDSFFAIEYWPEQFAPRWAAYKLDPRNFGEDGCNTYTRNVANCYFKEKTWEDFEACSSGSDPFHTDMILESPKLTKNAFSNTGHDRGHIAPRQAFSWHICGTYQTFTMANMSPQRAFLNQDIWMYLEQQTLTWAFDEGPIYVVSGTLYNDFPADAFSVYKEGKLKKSEIYKKSDTMEKVVTQSHQNFESTSSGDLLHPKRNSNPPKIRSEIKDQRAPTGYFKILYRPALGGEQEQAIGFLIPHSFENLNLISDMYDTLPVDEVFWAFLSRIDLIEKVSDIQLPGISESLKKTWGNKWFQDRRGTGRNIRNNAHCGRGTPKGVLEDTDLDTRMNVCTNPLKE